jgi:dethiobiotin synthetase
MRMSRLRGLFVTGTDTGVGKTAVSVGLLRSAVRRGQRPIPLKPAETGCAPDAEDARRLWQAAACPVRELDVCPHQFRLPAAPAQAAALEGRRLSLDEVVAHAQALASRGDWLLVEGAGGLLVPYGDDWTAADLIQRLGLPTVVVARTALGTINHTALTVRELQHRGLPIAALILNRTTPDQQPQEAGSVPYVASGTGLRPLGPIPWLPDATDADRLADALEAALGPAGLAALLDR